MKMFTRKSQFPPVRAPQKGAGPAPGAVPHGCKIGRYSRQWTHARSRDRPPGEWERWRTPADQALTQAQQYNTNTTNNKEKIHECNFKAPKNKEFFDFKMSFEYVILGDKNLK
jgi:hypothetical protein